ncbi:MAG TPA: helix-turn-helix domain-containing protein, partial [Spirochaetia bacterium]|nr:helix-turn-helix domain-containing protein [Spirochaetia bacterium]
VGAGGVFTGASEIGFSFSEAVRALEYRFVMGNDRTISLDDVPAGAKGGGPSECSEPFRSTIASLEGALATCDLEETTSALNRLSDDMRTSFCSPQQSLLQIHAVLVRLNDLRDETGLSSIPIEEFRALATLEAVMSHLSDICEAVVEARLRNKETYAGSKAAEAAQIVAQDYADPRLSLRSLCERIGVSPSYFSSLFKEHTGRTFVEYLTQTRVDRAKYLLKVTDLKGYEVAERIGYEDHRYFCTIFKKTTGRSPMEYRSEAAVSSTAENA